MADRPPSAAGAALATTAGSSLPGHGDDDYNDSILSSSSSASAVTPAASSSDADAHSRSESHSHARSHSHPHYRSHRHHHHGSSSHRHSHNTGSYADTDTDADDRSDSSNRAADDNTGNSDSSLELRQADAHDPPPEQDSWETRVVQTIELVQVVDTSGKPLSTSTNYVEPNTVVIDRESGETVAIPPPDPVNTAPAASPEASEDGPPAQSPPSPPVTHSTTTTQPDPEPEPEPTQSNASVGSDSSSQSPLVPAPSAPPPLPSGGHHNNTIPKNATVLSEPQSGSSRRKSSTPSTLSYTSTTDKESTSSYSKTTYESTYTSWTAEPTTTSEVGGWVAGPEGEAGTTQNSNSESGGGGGGGGVVLSEQQKHIVGGVVGSCAGLAFLVLLVFMALKYKRRRNEVQELIGDQGIRARELAGSRGSGGDGGSGAAGAMVERSNAKPFSVPAALASLAGRRFHPPPSPPAAAGESGFVRVSGRKLPSVLQHGGDGYTDPRESVMSGASDYYRGSQAFDPGSESHRLALGAPMRPVSGVPVMRMGPGRTPVTEQNPFADPFADPPSPTSPPPPPDALGRSLGSQDGSRVSASRFQENI